MELLVQVRILAGQLRGRPSSATAFFVLFTVGLLAAPGAGALRAQDPPDPPDLSGVSALGREAAPSGDSTDLHRTARDAQVRFERLRLRFLPRGSVSGSGSCQERVGRFCWWREDGDWVPTPEDPELAAHRDALLSTLDSVGRLLPGDDWVAGQRVWYRAEAARWDEALEAARGCAHPAWWCAALRGLAHHGAGRWEEARSAFLDALDGMDAEEARRWRHPVRAVDGDAREALEAARRTPPPGTGEQGAGAAFLERFWLLADPLWLVPGNDRETAHYARWTVSVTRVGARTPYGISWGRDLEELMVRHGWPLGWDRGWPEVGRDVPTSGHTHPEGRGFLPPGRAVLDPSSARVSELEPRQDGSRSLYAPPYAPLLLPMDGQLAVFPRGAEMAVVASHFLPADTSRHRTHQHGRPWLDAGDQAGLPERAGLFLVPADPRLEVRDGRLRTPEETAGTRPAPPRSETTADPGESGGLVLHAPAGRWIVSAERWSPERRRAGRLRTGLRVDTVAPDVARLSDLLLVEPGAEDAPTLEAAAARALPRRELAPGRAFGVVWELGGVGWRSEEVRYALSLLKEDGNLLRRAGRWLGILGEDEPLRLAWEEAGPEQPGVVLRGVRVDPGGLEAGEYRLLLEARLPGRAPLRSELPVRVVAGSPAGAGP